LAIFIGVLNENIPFSISHLRKTVNVIYFQGENVIPPEKTFFDIFGHQLCLRVVIDVVRKCKNVRPTLQHWWSYPPVVPPSVTPRFLSLQREPEQSPVNCSRRTNAADISPIT
jgi:hypothetical protein